MYIENLCCVAKGLQKAVEKISPVVWVYTAGEDEEAVDIFNQNFFYDVVEKLRTDDLLLIYTPLESTKIYWAKIIKIHNNITLEAISTGGGAGGDVISVNGKNGVVVLSATDILNQAQLDAVNSGITAEKVAEYDHNLEEFEQLNGEVATLEAEQQTIKSDLGDLGDQVIENNNAIATKNDIFQLDVFPDLNTPNVPNPFQYIGETIGSAIKGHIYEKVETDFTQWERNDNQTYIVTMGGALVGDGVYQADGKTMIGTITDISDDAMTYTDTDGQSVSTTYHSVFHTSGFEEVYTFGDDIDLLDYAKRTEVYTRDNADALFIKNAEKGQANGVATLNNMGVIPSEQVNISSLNVKGTWDASTNTPALTNGVGESGDFYITSVAGSVDFGAGEIAFAVGDWALYTDSGVWEKSVNASAVQSVNGKTGLVNVLDTDVLNEDQLKAVNSGIDEVKVQQIETNTTDIAETKTSLEELSMQVATNTGTIETKLDKTTDVANAGKSVVVDADGTLTFGSIIDDTVTSTDLTWSSSKISELTQPKIFGTAGDTQYLKLTIGNSSKCIPVTITDQYGGKIEILGMTYDGIYKTPKVVRYSYGDWSVYSATDYTYSGTDPNYKIRTVYYYPVNGCYYVEIRQYCTVKVSGAINSELVSSLPAETSEMTLIPESQYASYDGLRNTTEYAQGGTPFPEMYSNENPYRKLTVECYYARPQTFIITTSNGYYGKLFVAMNGAVLSDTNIKVITENGTAPFEIKYDNAQALTGSGHYSVDVFIHKTSGSAVDLNIKPFIQGTSLYTKIYTADDFVVSTADDFTNATKTASISTQYATKNDIIGTKTEYYGPRSVDVITGNRLTFIFSSTFSTCAGCYMLLSNYNIEPVLVQLGADPQKQFTVTAVHKSNSVDTITVSIPETYVWYILQF